MNIGKIIKLTENTVYIGYENGTLRKVAIESCDFQPTIGDYVEVYGDLVIKVDRKNKKVKKSIFEKLSLVGWVNLILLIVMIFFSIVVAFRATQVEFISVLIFESFILILLNLVFLIISSVKKSKVNKDISFKCLILALVSLIFLLIAFSVFTKETSKTVSKGSTLQTSSSSSTVSSTKSSSSTSKSSSSSSSSVSSKPKITVDKDKANYGEVDYNKWNHDEIAVGTKVRIYGKVLQAMEDGKAYTLRVALNDDYDKVILVSIPSEYNDRVIAEDDHITLYGLAKGRQSYETVFKATKTLPFMVAYMYEN